MSETTKTLHEAPTTLADAFGLTGKHALVTGGGSGIGLAISQALAAAGARVTIAGRDVARLREAAKTLGPEARVHALDVTDMASLPAFVQAVEADGGPIDILVNNAGSTVKKPFAEQTPEDIAKVLAVHVTGALELTRQIIPGQAARGEGSVIFIASVTSFIAQPLVLGYTTAKTAITGMVRALSAEYAGSGVRVNAIAPGWIDTGVFRAATRSDPDRLARIMGRIQAGRVGQPSDIGWTAVYLASPAAGYVTGQTLPVDGGAIIGF